MATEKINYTTHGCYHMTVNRWLISSNTKRKTTTTAEVFSIVLFVEIEIVIAILCTLNLLKSCIIVPYVKCILLAHHDWPESAFEWILIIRRHDHMKISSSLFFCPYLYHQIVVNVWETKNEDSFAKFMKFNLWEPEKCAHI